MSKRTTQQSAKMIRWLAFAEFVAMGKSATEAYKLAGYKARGHAAEVEASKCLRIPEVAQMVEEARDRASSERTATAIDLKEFWTKTMRGQTNDVVEDVDGKQIEVKAKLADRLKASDCLAKMLNVYNQTQDSKVTLTIRRSDDSVASLQKNETE